MRRLAFFLFASLLVTPSAQARSVKAIQPLAISTTQPLRITGMDLVFAQSIMSELAESDAKAAGKRADAGLAPLDAGSYPTGPIDGTRYATMPFKQMFPLIVRDVAREWRLDTGTPVFLRVTLDQLKTADAAVAILLAPSADILEGTVEVVEAGSGRGLGSFRVEVGHLRAGWAGMLVRGGGVRERLTEEFGREIARFMTGRKKPA